MLCLSFCLKNCFHKVTRSVGIAKERQGPGSTTEYLCMLVNTQNRKNIVTVLTFATCEENRNDEVVPCMIIDVDNELWQRRRTVYLYSHLHLNFYQQRWRTCSLIFVIRSLPLSSLKFDFCFFLITGHLQAMSGSVNRLCPLAHSVQLCTHKETEIIASKSSSSYVNKHLDNQI